MKKLITLILCIAFIGTGQQQVEAQENGISGLLFGAGSGALLGQAIGRDTEATLLGTAVGSMLGYVIGNEMDKGGYPSEQSHHPGSARSSYNRNRKFNRTVYKTRVHHYPVIVEEKYYQQAPVCRETEILATIDGVPEKVTATACLEDDRWVIKGTEEPFYKSQYKNKRGRSRYSNYDRLYYRSSW